MHYACTADCSYKGRDADRYRETQRKETSHSFVHLFLSHHFLSQLQSILISLVKGQYRHPVQFMYSRDQCDGRSREEEHRSLKIGVK